MNILPMIFALVLMLSLMTIERLDKIKQIAILQKEYQIYLKEQEGAEMRKRQERLYGLYPVSHKSLSFRYMVNQKLRDQNLDKAKQYRQLIKELMKVLYQDKAFYKNVEKERPQFLEELMEKIEAASNDVPEKFIRSTEDLSRLQLEDKQLQEVFYHMLKGTVKREELVETSSTLLNDPLWMEKAYPSLLYYVHLNEQPISIQRAPREVLKVIFEKDEIVDQVIKRREELSKKKEAGTDALFKEEFLDKRKQGISDQILDFHISASDKKKYV